MKLEQEDIALLRSVLSVAATVDIDSVIIAAPGVIRAMDEARTTFILHTTPQPRFVNAPTLAFSRAKLLKARHQAVNGPDLEISATIATSEAETFIRCLELSSKDKKTKVDFRCTNPTLIQAPKGLKDDLSASSFSITNEPASNIAVAIQAMGGAELTTLYTINGEVHAEVKDSGGDKLQLHVAGGYMGADFKHSYPSKLLQDVLKHHDTKQRVTVATRGILGVNIHSLNVYIMPRIL